MGKKININLVLELLRNEIYIQTCYMDRDMADPFVDANILHYTSIIKYLNELYEKIMKLGDQNITEN